MAWSNVEIVGNQEVAEVSYEIFCEEIKSNTKKEGIKQAIEMFVKEQFDLTGNICGIREQKNRNLFMMECDEAYSILVTALQAIVDSVLPDLYDRIRFYKSLNDRTSNNVDDMIQKNRIEISYIQGKKPHLQGLDSLIRLDSGKSVLEVAVGEMEKIIQLYCNTTGKDLPKMRSRIYYTMWQRYNYLIDIDYVKYKNGVFSLISASLTTMDKSKMERLEKPFSYYLDALD